MTAKEWWNGLSKEKREKWLKDRYLTTNFASKEWGELPSSFQGVLISTRVAES